MPSEMGAAVALAPLEDLEARDRALVLERWRAGLRPDPVITVSACAEAHRILAGDAASEPGRYRVSRTPYARKIMDALSPSHPAERVVWIAGSQVSKTETGNNWIQFVIEHAPGNVILVMPRLEDAKRASEERIDPLIEGTPRLVAKVPEPRSRDSKNRHLSKRFPGGRLVLRPARTSTHPACADLSTTSSAPTSRAI